MIAIFDEECVVRLVLFFHRPVTTIFPPWSLIDLPFFLYYSGGGTVDFQEFVGGLSAFSSRGGREEKLKCTSISNVQGI